MTIYIDMTLISKTCTYEPEPIKRFLRTHFDQSNCEARSTAG